MSDMVLIAVIAAVPATIGVVLTFTGLLLSLRNGRKADGIHKIVNSQFTALQSEFEQAKLKITDLDTIVVRLARELGVARDELASAKETP